MTERMVLTVLLMAAGSAITRTLPFIAFKSSKGSPLIDYLGKILPPTMLMILLVHCLKDPQTGLPSAWIEQSAALAASLALHAWKRNVVLSTFAGTGIYMVLLRAF